ncbi:MULTISPECIES: fatty acid desaturase family protein [Actinomadura]|uniref:Beta-carotene hydroxylase n=1 Tax=Actinomadura madurae TaxID=1993 RepID=A0A1I5H4D5_9ACTN|nr:fatty acid desaturase [Actinomadura madurae]SFO43043.1 beta-carotene hydroxylase [Actinomadura madurae]SPT57531.1 Fatty acid desaturase [Actinomadura madurae]
MIPRLSELGPDLLVTTRRRRVLTLSLPYAGIVLFAAVWAAGWWWFTPLVAFGIFVAVVTATHDVVHRSLGLGRRSTEWFLFLLGAVLLESGHAYRATHLQHHRTFPSDEDPEGHPADLSAVGAVLYGPVFLARLWGWAFRRASVSQRAWLLAEAALPFAAVGAGLLFSRGLLVYAVMVLVGSWVYPLLTVHLPHRHYGDTPLTQTHTLRGRVVPALFLELTYHLEHHLYPQVPSHHLSRLARRLDPVLAEAGVRPRKVI